MTDSVGFIGLGVMGAPMARNLVDAGSQLTVWNRSEEAVHRLVDAGARAGASAAAVAAASDVIITMLPDGPDVEQVVEGDAGIFEGARPGTLLIEMSTISPAVARSLSEAALSRGLSMLDAPVSGGDVGAREGTLSIMVGGEPQSFQRALAVLEVLGTTITHVGPAGAGQIVKACNQMLVANTIAAVAEALVLGSKLGVSPDAILDVLGGGLAANRVMEVRRSNFLSHDFTPGFKVDLHHKDLEIALAAGGEADVGLPLTAGTQQLFRALRAKGRGGDDHSALLSAIEDLAQHAIGSVYKGD